MAHFDKIWWEKDMSVRKTADRYFPQGNQGVNGIAMIGKSIGMHSRIKGLSPPTRKRRKGEDE